jgi:hypothetical protein
MTKKTTLTIYSLLLYVTIVAFGIVAKKMDPEWGNSPIQRLSGMYIAVIFYWGYALYLWKFNLPAFLKRLSISIPFATMFSVFIAVLGYDLYLSTLAGMFCSIMLLLRTTNWKKHFIVTLVSSCASSILGTLHLYRSGLGIISYATFFGFMLINSFLLLYLAKIVKDGKIPNLKDLFIRSLKFSCALSLLLCIYLVLNFNLYNRLELSFPVQLLANTLLSILFVAVTYKFDLFLFKQKDIKRNILGVWGNALNGLKGKTRSISICECCGKALPRELLFKNDSDKWVCAVCLRKQFNIDAREP